MITALVPIDLSRRPLNLLKRVARLLERAQTQGFQVVIGHNDRGGLGDHVLKKLCARRGATLVSNAFYEGEVNTARLRNEAIDFVQTPLTLLLDADVYVEHDVLTSVASAVLANEQPFEVLPCLYLSRRGSSELLHHRVTGESLLNEYLRFRRASFLHMAIPSSVVFFRTDDFRRAGSFDSGFTGHGYEDLDFLIRLGWLYDALPRSSDMLIDAPVRAPLLASGFRGQLVRLTLPSLLRGHVAFHIWHSTRSDVYYDARTGNATRFHQKLAARLQTPTASATNRAAPALDLSLIRAWMDMCRRHNVDVNQYSILFDNHPGHVDRLDTPMRRVNFLLGRY